MLQLAYKITMAYSSKRWLSDEEVLRRVLESDDDLYNNSDKVQVLSHNYGTQLLRRSPISQFAR